MTLFFFITLSLSASGLVLLLGLKHYELQTGHVIFAAIRPGTKRVLHSFVLFVQYLLPFIARRSLAHMFRIIRVALSAMLARLTLYVEASLYRMLRTMQQTMRPRRGGGPASAFLQEVADHKQKLLKDPVEKRAIFEEFK
jgi:hypothetical protein